MFGSELVARPESRQTGDGVEVLKVHEAADSFVVIAADEDVSESLRAGNHFVGITAVADRVSEIDDEVVSGSGGQTGVQRFEVAMNVAEKKDTHKGRIIAFLEGKRRGASTARSCLSEYVHQIRGGFTTGQRAQCSGLTSTSAGSSTVQAAMRCGQRGSKGHPGGSWAMGGTVPSMVASGMERSVASVGMARSRP